MVNERKTENFVRDTFNELGYRANEAILIEEQSSDKPRINKLLKNASKSGEGVGYPEFIVSSDDDNFVIVVECKGDKKFHESENRDQYSEYAVDGVINYMNYLKKNFDVIGIAVSGEKPEKIKVSNFLWSKKANQYVDIEDSKILTYEDYKRIVKFDPKVKRRTYNELMRFSKELHNKIRDKAKVSEPQKPLLVSAILIALEDGAFRLGYQEKSAEKLSKWLVETVKDVLENAEIPQKKIENMIQPYEFIKVHPAFKKGSILKDLIDDITNHVKQFISDYSDIDVIGEFYGEFLRYTGGDKQGLGIVLTPNHITELFADLANLTTESVVLDTCCGTGGFLISAMTDMIKKAGNDSSLITKIKRNNLIGVEQQPGMFALAASNMILRGDGKANLYLNDSFEIKKKLKKHNPTVGLINPPYAQEGEGLSELDFVENLLNCLEPNSIGIAIVPMSSALETSDTTLKENILENHTLEAVMSMPNELFYPVGIITCIMVFRAKVPHNPDIESWFGYWKDDGFEKTKNHGRIDKHGKWNEIKNKWLDAFFNRKEIPGLSVRQKVTHEDEWCAEAYMETDYSNLSPDDFKDQMKKHLLFRLMN